MPQTESPSNIIDIRSDTVTRPSSVMRQAMADAVVGDDVYGDDPTVIKLQEIAAEMLGKEAALFVPSGTQSNLCALLSHCGRGDEYIVGQWAHTYRYEGGGAAVLGSIQPQPLDFLPDGTLDLDQVIDCVKPDDPHFAKTRLLCLENTQMGKALPLDYLAQARAAADEQQLRLHLDGARIFNASVKLGVDVTEISRHFDSVSVCLSKGLGAPVGSVLCGSADLIGAARRWRKMLGGAMRQSGIVAAAGIVAISGRGEHLHKDHENAQRLAQSLNEFDQFDIDLSVVQTNMIFGRLRTVSVPTVVQRMKDQGVLISGFGDTLRLVTHCDFGAEDVATVTAAFERAFSG